MTGSGNVIKLATGAWVITGRNRITGTNFINYDELRVLGAITDGYVVASPGTEVTGTGYIERIQAQGTVSAGEDREGALVIGRELQLAATATADFGIGIENEVLVCSSIVITNPACVVDLGNATLRLTVSWSAIPIGTAFTLIDRAGSSPFTNFFAGLPEGSRFTVTDYFGSNYTFQITYTGGTGNDVVLSRPFPTLATVASGSNPFQFRVLGQPYARYVIDAATNLLNPQWLPIATNVADGFGILNWIDTGTAPHSQRFYRAR
jgi:hypothetical protein